ncbi:MAG: hypothetical protein AB1489_01205 [Acidobacteriota bacterium]
MDKLINITINYADANNNSPFDTDAQINSENQNSTTPIELVNTDNELSINTPEPFETSLVKQEFNTGDLLKFNLAQQLQTPPETASNRSQNTSSADLLAELIVSSTLAMGMPDQTVNAEQAAKSLTTKLVALYKQYRFDLDNSLGSRNNNPLQKQIETIKEKLAAAKAKKAELEKPIIPGSEVAELLQQIAEIDKKIAEIQAQGRKTSSTEDRNRLQLELLIEIAKQRSLLEKAIVKQSDPKVIEYIKIQNQIKQLENDVTRLELYTKVLKDLMKEIANLTEKNGTTISIDKIKENFNVTQFTPEIIAELKKLSTNPKEVIKFLQDKDLIKQGSPFYDATHYIPDSIIIEEEKYLRTAEELKLGLAEQQRTILKLTTMLSRLDNLALADYQKDWGLISDVPEPIVELMKMYSDMFYDAVSVWKVGKTPWLVDDLKKLDDQFKAMELPSLSNIFEQELEKYLGSNKQKNDAIEGVEVALLFTGGEAALGKAVMGPLATFMLAMTVGGNINRIEEILNMPRAENTIIEDGPYKDSAEVVKAKDLAHSKKQEAAIRQYFQSLLTLGTQVGTGAITVKTIHKGINSKFKDPLIKAGELRTRELTKEADIAESRARRAENLGLDNAPQLRQAANAAKAKLDSAKLALDNLQKALAEADKSFQDLMEAYRSGKTKLGKTLEEAKTDFVKSREKVREVLNEPDVVPSEKVLLKRLVENAEFNDLVLRSKPSLELLEELLRSDTNGKFLPPELKEPALKLRQLLDELIKVPKLVEDANFQSEFKANTKKVLEYVAKQMELPKELNLDGLPEFFIETLKIELETKPSSDQASYNPATGELSINPENIKGKDIGRIIRVLVHEFSHVSRTTLFAALKKANPDLYQKLALDEVLATVGKPKLNNDGSLKLFVSDKAILDKLTELTKKHIEKPLTDSDLRTQLEEFLKSIDETKLNEIIDGLKETNLKAQTPIDVQVKQVLDNVKEYLDALEKKHPGQGRAKAFETELIEELKKTERFKFVELLLEDIRSNRTIFDSIMEKITVRDSVISQNKLLENFIKDLETIIKELPEEKQQSLYQGQLHEAPSFIEGLKFSAVENPSARVLLKYYRSVEEVNARSWEVLFILKLLGKEMPLAKQLQEQWQQRPIKPRDPAKLPQYEEAYQNWQQGLDKILTEIGKDKQLAGLEKYSRELEVLNKLKDLDADWTNLQVMEKFADTTKIKTAALKLIQTIKEIRGKLDQESAFYTSFTNILDMANNVIFETILKSQQ